MFFYQKIFQNYYDYIILHRFSLHKRKNKTDGVKKKTIFLANFFKLRFLGLTIRKKSRLAISLANPLFYIVACIFFNWIIP